MRWVCRECGCLYTPGAPCCPDCRATAHDEEGAAGAAGQEDEVPKIDRFGVATIGSVTTGHASAILPDGSSTPPVIPPAPPAKQAPQEPAPARAEAQDPAPAAGSEPDTPPAPVPVADQKAAGVPPEATVTIAEQKAGTPPPSLPTPPVTPPKKAANG